MKQTYKEMNMLWIFVIQSLLIGLTLGYIIGSGMNTSKTGEATSQKGLIQIGDKKIWTDTLYKNDAEIAKVTIEYTDGTIKTF